MRSRPDSAHQDAVHRRLELLRAQPEEPAPVAEVVPLPTALGEEWRSVPWSTGAEPEGPEGPEGSESPWAAPPPGLPVPGRHASRRPIAWAELVPEQFRGRIALGTGQLTVLALIVAVGLVVTCWWVIRSSAAKAAVPATVTAAPLVPLGASTPVPAVGVSPPSSPPTLSAPAASAAAGGPPPAATVTVDVEGKVRHPGIVVLTDGARIVDAIKAAGGIPRRGVLRGINLAAVLTDGQQLMIGQPASPTGLTAPADGASGAAIGPSGAPTTRISLNSATAEQLDTIPGVGPVTAQAILTWRQQNGRFTSVDELMEVDGIGPATLAKIEPYVTP